jgi:site-specific DNA recombinase
MTQRVHRPTSAHNVKRCAIYTRKSTSEGLDKEFNSLDAQREACLAYIRAQPNWRAVDHQYDDGGRTGANLERPAFQRLLTDIEAGKIDVVVVYKVDRLSRSLLDFARVMDQFNAAGCAFVSVTQNFSTADAIGRLTLHLLMSFAEFEREMIAERTRDKIVAARRRGKWTGGPIPLGYTVKDRRLEIDEFESMVVREVFELFLQHGQMALVARELNARGRLTKHHTSRAGRRRSARPWTKDMVSRLLRNPIYAGLIQCGSEIYQGEHAAIIDRRLFEKAQEFLASRSASRTAHGTNPDYVLRGLLRCGLCGQAMTPGSTRKARREYRYYRCTTRDKHGAEGCPARPIPANAIEEYVIQHVVALLSDGTLAAEACALLTDRLDKQRATLHEERSKLPKTIGSLSAEAERLLEALSEKTGAARRIVDEHLDKVTAELGTLEQRLVYVERQLSSLDSHEVEVGWVTRTLRDFQKVWNVLTPSNQGRLLRAVLDKVVVDDGSGRVDVHVASFEPGYAERPSAEMIQ